MFPLSHMRDLFMKRTTLLRDLLLETDEENFVGYRSENNFVGPLK